MILELFMRDKKWPHSICCYSDNLQSENNMFNKNVFCYPLFRDFWTLQFSNNISKTCNIINYNIVNFETS